uniref:Uncharacterized protein n=1 Tax=Arundo donax TaxID=35708 RepID=A0A0A8YMQ4_ARUDO
MKKKYRPEIIPF